MPAHRLKLGPMETMLRAVGGLGGNMHAVKLVDVLKRLLKGRGITYAGVAVGLGLSEASVKRMFSRRDFTLQRLEDVCRVASIEFGELVQEVSAELPTGRQAHLEVIRFECESRHRHGIRRCPPQWCARSRMRGD